MPIYNPKDVEPRWQQFWEAHRTFRTPADSPKPKYYILDMFPYPSGAGLHVGHPEGYTATDILARYKRMLGFNVLHPMGWDAFGLPAEQYAIQTGTHPRLTTQTNIDNFRRQIKMLGFSYDWDREVDTTDPDYFRWTQWIFLELYDTWYDHEQNKGRPIKDLPIPADVADREAYVNSKRLAYQAEIPVNWCPALGTVLANEEVTNGRSERGNHPVVRMPLKQWLLRITEYAERLLGDLAIVDWPEPIKKMQRDWIGRSEGAEVDFQLKGSDATIRVFTTRPDTLFGATYMVLSPEHSLVDQITMAPQKAIVEAYKVSASHKSDMERTELAKTKTGVFTGAYAVNPVNGESVPIWIADYVLATYGTGAIMAVPAHDERDFEFAKTFDLPIRAVVQPSAEWLKKTKSTLENLTEAYCEEGVAVNSGAFSGLPTAEFKAKITAKLEADKKGAKKVNFKLRDWLFSRQRYWGEPFPILHEVDASGKRTGSMRTETNLPLRLPDVEDYKPTGNPEPPLSKAKEWMTVTEGGKTYVRETNTMPQWAGSCWYYLRYIDPKNSTMFADSVQLKHWLPVDLYVGGAEHAVLHLLYSRFWHKVLFDRSHVACAEPFQRLVNQGMILGETDYHVSAAAYEQHRSIIDGLGLKIVPIKDDDDDICILRNPSEAGKFAPLTEEQIAKDKGRTFLKGTTIELVGRADKMSKARGNVINPDDVVAEYGADALRLYEMFMGPLEATKPWSMRGVEGVFRFLNRVWRLVVDDRAEEMRLLDSVQEATPDKEATRLLHYTIKKVTDDLEAMAFNTAISAMMEFTNFMTGQSVRPKSALKTFVILLSPFAPHLAEELWHVLGGTTTLAYEPWPTFDASLLVAESVEVPIQINGKIRTKLIVATNVDAKELEALARSDDKVKSGLEGKTVRKVIVVPGKLVNFVAN